MGSGTTWIGIAVTINKGEDAICVAVGEGVWVGVALCPAIDAENGEDNRRVAVATFVATGMFATLRVGTRVAIWASVDGAWAEAPTLMRANMVRPTSKVTNTIDSVITPGQVPSSARV